MGVWEVKNGGVRHRIWGFDPKMGFGALKSGVWDIKWVIGSKNGGLGYKNGGLRHKMWGFDPKMGFGASKIGV